MPSLTHDTFTLERHYRAAPDRVFQAFADPVSKAQWFGCVEGWTVVEHRMDFRVGGHEVWRLGPPGEEVHGNDTTYHDIVPGERIVWSYTMSLGERRISVSLASLELRAEGGGTRLVLTEHGIFLDGYAGEEERVRGTEMLLGNLGRFLERPTPAQA